MLISAFVLVISNAGIVDCVVVFSYISSMGLVLILCWSNFSSLTSIPLKEYLLHIVFGLLYTFNLFFYIS